MSEYMTHGIRIGIDAELQACLDREHGAEQEAIAARRATREVLDRKLGEEPTGDEECSS
jgi:hypothetical protein